MKKLMPFLLLAAFASCSKKDGVQEISGDGAYQMRVAAIDNNGTKTYTPIIRVKSGKVAVEFETEAVSDIREYNVEVSLDGVHFNPVKTIVSDMTTPNRLYRDTVLLK